MPAELDVAKDLVPITHLGDASKYVREVVQTGRPKVVTEGGVGVAVILDVATFEALSRETSAAELLRDLQAALADADAGNLVDHEEVMRRARAHFEGRVSPELMRQLEAL
jgi:prevent-host-death family protein